ncbi:MFS transporter, DHA1 family, chloramphenicol resistance protein [Micromonospora matsumotoense]|uniref:MFS transporter, DHA1 family, chloramphenicol resistance protein n=1 Tax=Micromonospora matsumotoense TaxID=121616 RepID=A0A1C4VKW5_9ACTN|nr:MFS transporter [Micromonospora matsumotoense]SCE84588.1 MFS transporter, DHA1 family, chloramphenicol resistance protein [Micromonospora matsumotoense]
MLAGLVPDIATSLDVSVGAAGLLTSAFAVGMIVGAPLMAALARRWPARTSLLGFVLAFAVAHVVGALTTSFAVLLGTRVVAALANAGFLAVALSTAATLVAADRKGRALAVLLSGTTVAVIAGVPGGALLGMLLGWRATFWAIALLCLPAAGGVVMGLPARVATSPRGAPVGSSLRGEIAQLARPRLVLVMLVGALVNAATFATPAVSWWRSPCSSSCRSGVSGQPAFASRLLRRPSGRRGGDRPDAGGQVLVGQGPAARPHLAQFPVQLGAFRLPAGGDAGAARDGQHGGEFGRGEGRHSMSVRLPVVGRGGPGSCQHRPGRPRLRMTHDQAERTVCRLYC